MATRDANQGAGVESGLSQKTPIGDYMPRQQNEKNGRPQTPQQTSAPGGHKIK